MMEIFKVALFILVCIFAAAFSYWVIGKLVMAAGDVPVFLVITAQIVVIGAAVVAIIWRLLPYTR